MSELSEKRKLLEYVVKQKITGFSRSLTVNVNEL